MVLDNFRTIELIWDKANKSIIKTIKTASSDTTGRYLSVKVLDGGQEVTLDNAKLQLYWEHPNFNTSGTDEFSIVNNGGLFNLTFSDEMLTNIGELNAHLVLTLADGTITSDGFPIKVFKGADDGVVVPTNGNGLVKQVANKIDKGNVTLDDLTQEVKLAMTGGSVAVVGENAVDTENIKDSSVTTEKTNFISKTVNLFIVENSISGKAWSTQTDNSITLIDSANIVGSEKITLRFGETHLYKNKKGGAIFVGKDGKLVKFVSMSTKAGALEIPSGATHVVLNLYDYDVSTYQIEYGQTGSEYVKGEHRLIDSVKIDKDSINEINPTSIQDESIPLNKLELERSLNLFNSRNVSTGFIDRKTGEITYWADYATSTYIPLADKPIIFNKITNNLNIAYYDKNGTFHSGYQATPPAENIKVVPPIPEGSFRLSVTQNDIDELIVQYGDEITTNNNYYVYPKGMVLPKSDVVDSPVIDDAVDNTVINDRKLYIKMTNTALNIHKRSTKTGSDKWLRMIYDYFKDDAINADGWGINVVDAVKQDHVGNFSKIFPVTLKGEWEMAITIDSAPDFIGLRAHGSEVMTEIRFYKDGTLFAPTDSEAYCDELKVIQFTNMYNPHNEVDHVANHIKEYIWTYDKLVVNNKIEWLSDHVINDSYLTMLPATRGNDDVTPIQVTDTYYDNHTYKEWDVGSSGFVTYPNLREVKGSKIYLYGKNSGVSMSAESIRDTPVGRSFVQNKPNSYNKVYFFMTETSVTAGDVTTGTSVYEYTINT